MFGKSQTCGDWKIVWYVARFINFDGSLTLDLVLKPIDPMRWTPAPRTDANMLSPLAVRVLTENSGCIMFVGVLTINLHFIALKLNNDSPEPTVSKSTAQKRAFREAVRLVLESVTKMADTTSATVSDLMKEYTPMNRLTRSANKAWSKSKLSRQRFLKRYEAEVLMAQMFACMFLMIFIIYMIHTTLGRMRFEPRQRAWNWARTGSFML
ncbi:hypothetical protein MPER_05766 [Moniliophthora perniciosa FA553]|nr:hypothetical protein MPER_05766 [Moniliophthora perniciosa FA553]